MKPELLAPVNLRTLSAAVQAGADAVYLGGKSFGARKFADNFDMLQMEQAVDYCHLRGVKVYVTANILVSDTEIKDFLEFVTGAYNIGVDAFILQDIGMAKLIKNILPDAKIHASTQLTVHNTDGASFMKDLGFERVVTARELSREDIFDIAEKSGIETEIFVHGALCMSYSGQCLMSSMIGGRSGNRGSCAQPCRLPYELKCSGKTKKGYFLSPRDLSLAGNMTDILKSEVTSLKIEGRMKGPEYVAAAVSVLRKLIDEGRNCTADELKMLENAFSRNGFTSGLFTGDISGYINSASGNDDIYKNRDVQVLKNLTAYMDASANLKRTPVCFDAVAISGKPFELTASAMGFEVIVKGNVIEPAQNKPTDEQTIEKQLAKTGNSPFVADKIKILTDGKGFLSLSEINSMRRESLERLEEKIVSSSKKNESCRDYSVRKNAKKRGELDITVMVTDENQLKAVRQSEIKNIIAPCELARADEIAAFPDIIHNDYMDKYIKILENTPAEKVYTANYAIIRYAKKIGKSIMTSSALNIFNGESLEYWKNFGIDEAVVSQELNLKQIERLSGVMPIAAMAYGKTVMMKTAVCPVKAAMKKCGGKDCKAYLKDRKNEEFPVICNGMTSFVLNSKPVYMADKLKDIANAGIDNAVIHFTDEPSDECKRIIGSFLKELASEKDFTRGHFYRGVT